MVQIYKATDNGDSVLAEKEFTCEDDYTLSGDDITLPDIVW